MCCILPVMHSDALLCIPVHLGGKIPDFDERLGAILLVSWCLRMHLNAHECARMRQNAPEYTRDHTHTYTREAERTQGQTQMDGYGLDGLWACHKACHKSTHVPLHVIQVFIFRLGCECICVHKWMRVWVNASECAWIRKNASASECNVSTECTLCVDAYKCIWMQLM